MEGFDFDETDRLPSNFQQLWDKNDYSVPDIMIDANVGELFLKWLRKTFLPFVSFYQAWGTTNPFNDKYNHYYMRCFHKEKFLLGIREAYILWFAQRVYVTSDTQSILSRAHDQEK